MRKTNEDYLNLFYSLPDLLSMAIEQSSGDRYKMQDEIRGKYRNDGLTFRWSMPLRGLGVCRKCSEKFTQVAYEMENPKLKTSIGTSSSHIHAVEKHGAEMDAELKKFLDETA